jgi:putative ABC transport system permease protein
VLRTTLAGLYAHKLRLLASSLAIVLSVGFVAGTLIFADTARAGFFHAFAAQAANVDASVESPSAAGKAKNGETPPPLPDSMLQTVQQVPGAGSVEGRMSGPAALYDKQGKLIANGSETGVAIDVPADPRFRWFTVASGRLPANASEALLDSTTATASQFHIGDSLSVLDSAGRSHRLRLVGLADLGVAKNLNGDSVVALTSDGMRALGIRGYDRIDVAAAPGVSQSNLVSRIDAAVHGALPAGGAVVTGAQLAHDLADSVVHQVNQILQGILVFAVVALLVAAIVILNTFNILVAQRLRQLALLRCVGATTRQVFASVVLESLVVGLLASAAGVLAGFGITAALSALLGVIGAPLPSGSGITVSTGTVLLSIGLGAVVTMAAAVWPAWRATRVPPIAALRAPDLAQAQAGSRGRRKVPAVISTVLCAAGAGLSALGVSKGFNGLLLEAVGGMVFFIGVLVASPMLVDPLARLLGWLPGRIGGVPARLATANARRNPGRTAATMIALTLGVGLITTFSVVTASAKSAAFSQLDQNYPIDYVVSPLQPTGARDDATLPNAVTSALRQQSQLSTVAPQWEGFATLGRHSHIGITALDASAYGRAFTPKLSSGSTDSLVTGTGGVALRSKLADSLHVKLGDTVTLLAPHRTERLKVVAISSTSFLDDEALISAADFMQGFQPSGPIDVLIKAAPGTTAGQSQAAVNHALTGFPLTRVQSVADYKGQLTSAINGLLAIFDGLLGIAIIIALFGIANTLSLSVIERTQESGLLRALGLTRGQLRRMLSAEALLIGVMGGIIGIVIGTGFGSALSETVIQASGGGSPVSYPTLTILLYVALAGLAGLAAGVLPARRAAKTSVIEAITRP